MRKGKDISVQFGSLFLVHQNVPGKKAASVKYNQHILFIPLQGEITIEVANQKIAFGLGQMLYLAPHTLHSFSSSEKFGERLIAMLDAELLTRVSTSEKPTKLPLNQFVKELLFYLLLHPKLKSAKTLVSVFVETLQESLAENLFSSHIDMDRLAGKVVDGRIKEALNFMQENLSEAITIEKVAKKAGLSGRNFNRLVLKETGLQPKQWLIRFRIEKAKELLKTPNISVTDTAYAVGYNSLGQFISAFRALTKQLPSEFLRHG
jgi:AraC-like DNA-binding protein